MQKLSDGTLMTNAIVNFQTILLDVTKGLEGWCLVPSGEIYKFVKNDSVSLFNLSLINSETKILVLITKCCKTAILLTKYKFCSLTYFYPLMPDGCKPVCLSMYGLLHPSGIKGLIYNKSNLNLINMSTHDQLISVLAYIHHYYKQYPSTVSSSLSMSCGTCMPNRCLRHLTCTDEEALVKTFPMKTSSS